LTADFNSIYDNDREARQHRMAIEKISLTTGKPLRDIQPVYETALRDLKRSAHIKDYLLILVTRKVESMVRA
jgi:hypothetical protein